MTDELSRILARRAKEREAANEKAEQDAAKKAQQEATIINHHKQLAQEFIAHMQQVGIPPAPPLHWGIRKKVGTNQIHQKSLAPEWLADPELL